MTAFSLALLFPALLSSAPANDFPQFKGDASRSGYVATPLKPPVREVWRVKLKGSLYSSPAISEGRVILGSSAKRVYALNLEDGKTLWETELPDKVWGSGPALEGGSVYVGGVEGCVHVLKAATGELQRRLCADPPKGFLGKRDLVASPLVYGSLLVFGTDDKRVYAYGREDGQRRWAYQAGGIVHDNAACGCGDKVLIGDREGWLHALDPKSGAALWKAGPHKGYNSTPACAGSRAFVGAADEKLRALQLGDGSLAWEFKADGGIMSSPALGAAGEVVFGASGRRVYCLESDGHKRWDFKTKDHVLASPLITGSTVWIGSYDGYVYALDLADGRELWKAAMDGGVFAAAAVAGTRVVVAGRSGEVACFEATK